MITLVLRVKAIPFLLLSCKVFRFFWRSDSLGWMRGAHSSLAKKDFIILLLLGIFIGKYSTYWQNRIEYLKQYQVSSYGLAILYCSLNSLMLLF